MALVPYVFDPSLPALERGQLWRFRDGREGVVASANAVSATVYVGPQAHMIPAGDLRFAFDGATLVDRRPAVVPTSTPPASELDEHRADEDQVVTPVMVWADEVETPPASSSPVAVRDEPAPERIDVSALAVEPPIPAPEPAAAIVALQHARNTAAGRSGARRDRKRDPQV